MEVNHGLLKAVLSGNLREVQALTSKDCTYQERGEILFCNEDGYNSVHLAVIHDRQEIVKHILNLDPLSLEIPTMTEDMVMPLHLAVRETLPIMTEILVKEFNANVNVIDSCANTPLHYAASTGSLSIVDTLLKTDKQALYSKNIYDELPIDHSLNEVVSTKLLDA